MVNINPSAFLLYLVIFVLFSAPAFHVFGDQAFLVATFQLCNHLPHHVTLPPSLPALRKCLKTHFSVVPSHSCSVSAEAS